MPDTTMNETVLVTAVGGAAGLAGGSVVALSENMTRRQVLATVIAGTGFGSFVPPALMSMWQFPPAISGLVGFVCGLTCIGLVAGFQKISAAFGRRPGAFISQIKDAMAEETKQPLLPTKTEGDK